MGFHIMYRGFNKWYVIVNPFPAIVQVPKYNPSTHYLFASLSFRKEYVQNGLIKFQHKKMET